MASTLIQPKLIIHGGAGSSLRGKGGEDAVRQLLFGIVDQIYGLLQDGATAQAAVIQGCRLLEDEPRFNAGTGSVLQSDGQIRMSAALMDGLTQRFSGVINVSRIKNPIELAEFLQGCSDRVLSDIGAAELVRELRLPIHDPLTDLRLQEWIAERNNDFSRDMAGVIAEAEPASETGAEARTEAGAEVGAEAGRGTIGVVALDQAGRLAVGTSTGGKGFERIGRVSDSAMPAGNYASTQAAVSCTGIGEDIIDECLAPRIVVRVADGLALADAFARSFQEAGAHQRDLGAIGLSQDGAIAWGKTSEVLLAAYHNGTQKGDTLALAPGVVTGHCS